MTENSTHKPQPTRVDLRNFGLTFAGVGAVIATVLWWKGRAYYAQFGAAAAAFVFVGLFVPRLLGPFFGPWMKFAEILGAINTKILLGVFFFIGLTPISFVLKALGKDPMNRRFKDSKTPTYWNAPSTHQDGARHFERQF